MHPYVEQALAAERVRDWHRQAGLARRAKWARRARHPVVGEVLGERPLGGRESLEIERVRQADIPEGESVARNHGNRVGAGRP